jgi:hypothetical protein
VLPGKQDDCRLNLREPPYADRSQSHLLPRCGDLTLWFFVAVSCCSFPSLCGLSLPAERSVEPSPIHPKRSSPERRSYSGMQPLVSLLTRSRTVLDSSTLRPLPPGTYNLTVEAKGFTRWEETGIVEHQGESHSAPNIVLAIGSVTAEIRSHRLMQVSYRWTTVPAPRLLTKPWPIRSASKEETQQNS